MRLLLFGLSCAALLVAVVRFARVVTDRGLSQEIRRRYRDAPAHQLTNEGALQLQVWRFVVVLVAVLAVVLTWPLNTGPLTQEELGEQVSGDVLDDLEGLDADDVEDFLVALVDEGRWSLYPLTRESLVPDGSTQREVFYQALSADSAAATCITVVVATETDLVEFASREVGFC